MNPCARLMRLLRELISAIRDLEKVIRLRKPGLVSLHVIKEVNAMLTFVLNLPTTGAADVVSRELTTQINDGQSNVAVLPVSTATSEPMQGPDNAVVSGTLVDIDDAGNRSEPRSFSFILTDTIPPPIPGEVGLTVTAEN